MLCSELQCKHSQNSTSASHVKNLCRLCCILSDLTDTKLCCLMHSCTKCCTWINMDHHLIFIRRLHIFPGWNNQNIIHIELMKILLPVIHPVYILCLGFFNLAGSDIYISRHLLQFFLHICQNFLFVLILFQIKT